MFYLSPAVKEKLTADPDSEIATTSLRVSLLCPVNILPAPHEFNAVFRHPFTLRRVCPFFLLFSCFSVCLNTPLTLICVRDPPVKLSCLPLSSTLSMWVRRVCDIYAFIFPPSHPCCLWLLYALTARVCTHCAAGEDAADDPMPGADMLPPAVLWRHTLHPDEREEANLGVSCLWQEGPLWTPHHRRVSHPKLHRLLYDPKKQENCQNQSNLNKWIKLGTWYFPGTVQSQNQNCNRE